MRKVILIGIVLAAVFAVAVSVRAFAKTTVTGQLVDIACYSQDKTNTGNHHKGRGLACAQACALEGFPVGLVGEDGKLYQVIGDLAANKNAMLVPHMTHTVTISGEVAEKDGQPTIEAGDLKMVHE